MDIAWGSLLFLHHLIVHKSYIIFLQPLNLKNHIWFVFSLPHFWPQRLNSLQVSSRCEIDFHTVNKWRAMTGRLCFYKTCFGTWSVRTVYINDCKLAFHRRCLIKVNCSTSPHWQNNILTPLQHIIYWNDQIKFSQMWAGHVTVLEFTPEVMFVSRTERGRWAIPTSVHKECSVMLAASGGGPCGRCTAVVVCQM